MNVPAPADPPPASAPIPTLTLPTGAPIPVLGFGTYKIAPDDTYEAISRALNIGYRHIDTAQMYGNEAEVGAAIETSEIPRDEIFLTTKVDNSNHEPERAAASIQRSLNDLRTDYVDLLLVHWPLPTLYGGDVTSPGPPSKMPSPAAARERSACPTTNANTSRPSAQPPPSPRTSSKSKHTPSSPTRTCAPTRRDSAWSSKPGHPSHADAPPQTQPCVPSHTNSA